MEQEPQKEKRSAIARMVKWWFLATAGALASSFLSVVAVLSDWEGFFYFFILLGIFFIALQGLFLLFALFTRQWGHAIGTLCGIIASLVIGFLCIIMVAAGQHHPPKFNEEDIIMEDSLLEVTDSVAP